MSHISSNNALENEHDSLRDSLDLLTNENENLNDELSMAKNKLTKLLVEHEKKKSAVDHLNELLKEEEDKKIELDKLKNQVLTYLSLAEEAEEKGFSTSTEDNRSWKEKFEEQNTLIASLKQSINEMTAQLKSMTQSSTK